MITLIESKTAAETTDYFSVGTEAPVTLVCDGLSGVETIELQIMAGTTWVDVYDYTTKTQIMFKIDANVISLTTPGKYRLVKGVTSAATGVWAYVNRITQFII
jgi:hypothetical protein